MPALSHFLTPKRIVFWNQPVPKELALRTLVDAAVGDGRIGDPATVLEAVLKREGEGSTFTISLPTTPSPQREIEG